jgi:hypothetical protein
MESKENCVMTVLKMLLKTVPLAGEKCQSRLNNLTMKGILRIIVFLVILLGGCKESEDPSNDSLLLGNWKLRSYHYEMREINGKLTDLKEGDFNVDSFLEFKSDKTVVLRINNNTYEARWSTSGEGAEMKIYLNMVLPYPDPIYDIKFPVGGFEVKELTSQRLTIYFGQHYGIGLNEFQTIFLVK